MKKIVQAKRRTPMAQKHKLVSALESTLEPVIKNSESNVPLDPSRLMMSDLSTTY